MICFLKLSHDDDLGRVLAHALRESVGARRDRVLGFGGTGPS